MPDILDLKVGQQIGIYCKDHNLFYAGSITELTLATIRLKVLKTNTIGRATEIYTNKSFWSIISLCEDYTTCYMRFICLTN